MYEKSLKQQQRNAKERKRVEDFLQALRSITDDVSKFKSRIEQARTTQLAQEESANSEVLQRRQPRHQKSLSTALTNLMSATTAVDAAIATVEQVRAELGEAQAKQTAEFTELQKVHQQADERSGHALNCSNASPS